MFRKLIIKVKQKIRHWLGLGEMFIGVDVGYKSDTTIIIVSRLHGGHIKIIDIHPTDFKDLHSLIKELQMRYGISNRGVICDWPQGLGPIISKEV